MTTEVQQLVSAASSLLGFLEGRYLPAERKGAQPYMDRLNDAIERVLEKEP